MPTSIDIARPETGSANGHTPHDSGHDEEIDRELLALPSPPKRERTLTVAVMLLTAVASVLMIVALRRDVAFALSRAEPQELGDLGTLRTEDLAAIQVGALAHAEGLLGAAHAIRYERPLREGSFRLMPIVMPTHLAGAGRPTVWVELHVPSGSENVRYVPPKDFTGRWMRFEGPKNRGLSAAIRDVTGNDVPKDAWLITDGDVPSASRWAVLLAVLFAGFAVWNVASAVRLVRRVP